MLLEEMVKEVAKIDGAVIECGVYNGDSAQVIVDAVAGKKKVFLVDCFDGLPHPRIEDGESIFKKGDYKGDYEKVKQRFVGNDNVVVIKGMIPEVFKQIENEFFSFVHLDLDLYKPTLEALLFFVKKLQKGGTIMVHDKSQEGIKSAILQWEQEVMDYYVLRNIL
jgi:O-methyltransferase